MNLPAADSPEESGAEPTTPADTGTRKPVSRKQLDDIFGDVLPAVTSDELDEQDGRGSAEADRDRWYRDNRPPHHG